MAISYTDSVKQNTKLRASMAYQSIAEDFPAVYGSEDWTLDSRYKYCPEYHDDNVVMIDDQKSVSSKTSKIVVTQGANSEFIPFELERYYDGFDLCNTVITIHFLNKNGFDDYANPINVYYSDDKIRLGWLVDNKVTAVEGIVQFEIEAVGQNSGGERYEWRTRPSDCISVLKSISGNGPIKPDSNWVVDLIGRLQNTEAEIEELKSKIGDVPSAVVEVDPTLTQDGMAADAKAVGDRIGDLPIRKNENTGYTQIEGLPRANGTVFTKNGTTITVSTTLEDGTEVNGTLTLDDTTGYPVSYTEDGHVHTFTFSGFDDSTGEVTE